MSLKVNHKYIEKKWQKVWQSEKLYTPNIPDTKSSDKFYNLWMFPYPSAEGLHAGHAFASTGSDIYGRFMRMNGKAVFQPIGYDSFGIHSENYAIKIGETPQRMLARTTKHYESQLRSLGHGYDWTRTVTTSDVDYYKWTQWLFLQMFKGGLAYKKKANVNFCPSCKTVLADEQVVSPSSVGKTHHGTYANKDSLQEDRVCERCGTVVQKKELLQWFFRITDYSDRLLTGLGKINWSDRVKIAQREWIGKKEGVLVDHKVKGLDLTLTAFSAYPAWLFADTFLVLAPEHLEVLQLVKGTLYESKVLEFVKKFKKQKNNHNNKAKEKDGVFTGRYVTDPITGRELPVWLANFALMDFGTGVIRCSAHDPRDYEFAKKYKIELEEVVERIDPKTPVNAHLNQGKLKNSGQFTNRDIDPKLIRDVVNWIAVQKYGKAETSYHLRDWLVSRQRYWGAPIPMIYCENCASEGRSWFKTDDAQKFPKIGNFELRIENSDSESAGWWPDENLPVELPEMKHYEPDGSGNGPLAHHPEFYSVKCPHCGTDARRETDVMDTFVDSSWYFLRYPSVGINPKSEKSASLRGRNPKQSQNSKIKSQNSSFELRASNFVLPWDQQVTEAWLPVDLYFGGAEHSVLHLMYARFVNMVMHDLGYIDHQEPFPKFFAHGLMIKDGAKMSKSRGNVINPDEYIEKFGADTMRLYLMFMGPMDGYPDFRDTGIEGMQKFVNRVWNLYKDIEKYSFKVESNKKLVYNKLHLTIKKVTEYIKEFKYNISLAAIMELVNTIYEKGTDKEVLKTLIQLLAPFAPHFTEEIWHEYFGEKESVHISHWPKYQEMYLKEDKVTLIVQVNGKVRAVLNVEFKISNIQKEVVELAKTHEKVSNLLKGKTVKKTIFVSGKLINFVV